jgi:LmbE family N-acetylglucosaminyl deacetylase
VDTVEFLDHRDGVIEYGLPLRRDLARAIRRHRPEVIIITNFDFAWPGGQLNSADHRAVGLAACDAAQDAGNRWIFPELRAEGFEPWGGTRRVFVNADPASDHACDVGDALERGIASLRAHRAYLEHLGGGFQPDEFLRGRASELGARLGCQYAVDFRVLRV